MIRQVGWSLSVVGRKGKVHTGRIFTESHLPIVAEIDYMADSGYQGLAKLQVNSYTPIKKLGINPWLVRPGNLTQSWPVVEFQSSISID